MDWFDSEADVFSGKPLTSLVDLNIWLLAEFAILTDTREFTVNVPQDTLVAQTAAALRSPIDKLPQKVDAHAAVSVVTFKPSQSDGAQTNKNQPLKGVKPQRKRPDTRKLMIDVQKLLAYEPTVSQSADNDEKSEHEVRLALSLGAKPPKRTAVNYKTLKEARATEKKREQQAREQFQVQSKFLRSKRSAGVKKKKFKKK